MKAKVGFGYDIHRLAAGRPLYLGGLRVPHRAGLAGHSDGDCLIHALIDALLGALGEGDIGTLFPDTDRRYKGVRSTALLQRVMSRLRRSRMEVLNVDAVIVAQAPRLAPYVGPMKEALSPILHIPTDRIGIKAKTNEGLGLVGREKALACWAVALVQPKQSKKSRS
ncbi:MAG: 2-C-methyl-D-erythritol 2,4-cyclodiphosphate synthase [Acidobacteriota bacterium]